MYKIKRMLRSWGHGYGADHKRVCKLRRRASGAMHGSPSHSRSAGAGAGAVAGDRQDEDSQQGEENEEEFLIEGDGSSHFLVHATQTTSEYRDHMLKLFGPPMPQGEGRWPPSENIFLPPQQPTATTTTTTSSSSSSSSSSPASSGFAVASQLDGRSWDATDAATAAATSPSAAAAAASACVLLQAPAPTQPRSLSDALPLAVQRALQTAGGNAEVASGWRRVAVPVRHGWHAVLAAILQVG
jgi:hypothetical protein